MHPGHLLRTGALVVALASQSVLAAQVDVTFVGTWASTGSGNSAVVDGPGLAAGQRFVIRTSYDDTSAVTNDVDVLKSSFAPSGEFMSTVNLQGAGNSLDIFVPMEGLDSGSPFIYTQNEANHQNFFVPNPTLNFINNSAISDAGNIIGLEFEGNFVTGAEFNVVELFNVSPGVGTINMESRVLNCIDAGCLAGQVAATGVNTLALAGDLEIDAGPDLVYDAGTLSRTTSSAIVQSNDLGNARSDGEDFIDAVWSQTGTASGNDVTVGIANAGLANTTDSATWTVTMTEQMTQLSDDDALQVTYANAGPVAEAGGPIVFDAGTLVASTTGASVTDPDLVVNASIANFEQVSVSPSVAGGAPIAPSVISSSTPANALSYNIAVEDSGLTMTTSTGSFDLAVQDLAGAPSSDSAVISYLNAAPTATASATANATGYDFALSADDVDEIVNTLIAGFEMLTVTALVDGLVDATGFFADLIMNGTQSAADAALETAFGVGLHTVAFTATDKAGLAAVTSADFEVTGGQVAAPEPGALALLLAGLAGVGVARRRAGAAASRTR